MGRKTTFTEDAADEIIARLSEGEPLAQICRDSHFPTAHTVYDWLGKNEEFASRFARAREDGFDRIALDALSIADATIPQETERDATRDRLRVETRLKLLAKWDPRRYGDKQQIEHSGSIDMRQQFLGME